MTLVPPVALGSWRWLLTGKWVFDPSQVLHSSFGFIFKKTRVRVDRARYHTAVRAVWAFVLRRHIEVALEVEYPGWRKFEVAL